MSINEFAILLANRIQEKSNVKMEYLASRYIKSLSTIRRTILEINEYIPAEKQFIIADGTVLNQMEYADLVYFIRSLKITDYATTIDERIDYLMLLSFTGEFVNLSRMYDNLNISQSTRKKDRLMFTDLLKERGFEINSFPSKGIKIIGKEEDYRIELTKIIFKVIEINENNELEERLANNPIQKLIYMRFSSFILNRESEIEKLKDYFSKHGIRINYTSKKFIWIYYLISYYRIEENMKLNNIIDFHDSIQFSIFKEKDENILFNAILVSLDYSDELHIPIVQNDFENCALFVEYIEKNIRTTFYTRENLTLKVYNYIYKVKIRNYLKFDFYDNKLDHVSEELSFLFNQVSNGYNNIVKNQFH